METCLRGTLLLSILIFLVEHSFEHYHKKEVKSRDLNWLEDLQTVPPKEETVRKLMENFLEIKKPRTVYKRQLANYFDVLYVLDSSSSISKLEFRQAVSAIRMLVRRSKAGSRVAAITIATRAKTLFNFTTRADAGSKLRTLRRSGGKTNTQEALGICYEMFTTSKYRSRPGSFKRALVVTDGHSNIKRHETVKKALKLKKAGIEVFVVAVGGYLDGIEEIANMASTTFAHMFRVEDMRDLVLVVKLIPKLRKQWVTDIYGDRSRNGDSLGNISMKGFM